MGNIFGFMGKKKETEVISFEQLADELRTADYVVALTGAGVSAESGIPTFRDPGDGLWERYDPSTYATIWGFWRHPEKIWELLRDFCRENDPEPNDSHRALYFLETMGKMKAIVTQNVDNLHQDAGSTNVIEYHGNLMKASCYRCGAQMELSKALLENTQFTRDLPPVCSCGGVYKPNAVLFGEAIPYEARKAAQREVDRCDLLLIVGTSASVSPASSLPSRAAAGGARVIEVNIESTGLTNRLSDKIVYGRASGLMKTVMSYHRPS